MNKLLYLCHSPKHQKRSILHYSIINCIKRTLNIYQGKFDCRIKISLHRLSYLNCYKIDTSYMNRRRSLLFNLKLKSLTHLLSTLCYQKQINALLRHLGLIASSLFWSWSAIHDNFEANQLSVFATKVHTYLCYSFVTFSSFHLHTLTLVLLI